MEEMESLEKISEAFLRTAKKVLQDLLARNTHPNRQNHYPLNHTSPAQKDQISSVSSSQDPQQLRECFIEQGVKPERLERFAVGWIDHPEAMFQRLLDRGFSAEALRESKLLADRRLAGRLLGPIQTPSGKIVSFWARSINSQQEGPKYLYWRPDWKAKVPAVWLPTALLRGARKKGLLVVEDIWEALLLQMHGFFHTVALGESAQPILVKQLAQFAQLRIPSLTVAWNQTGDFPTRLARLREVFQRGEWPFRLWLLPPEQLGRYGSPAELVRKEGLETFRNLLFSKRIAIESRQGPLPPTCFPKPETSSNSAASLNNEEPSAGRRAGGKICPLHHCLETECFCFD